jgi:hypothetical protein
MIERSLKARQQAQELRGTHWEQETFLYIPSMAYFISLPAPAQGFYRLRRVERANNSIGNQPKDPSTTLQIADQYRLAQKGSSTNSLIRPTLNRENK